MAEDNNEGGKILKFGADVTVEWAVMGFAHLLKPDTYLGKSKYKIDLMWPDSALPKTLIAAADAVARETWGVGLDKLAYKGLKKGSVLADEYDERNDDEPDKVGGRDGYRGYHVATATLNKKPFLIDKRLDPLSDDDAKNLIYPGAKVRAKLTPATFKGQKGKGVTFFIKTLQLVSGGDPIDGFSGGGGGGGRMDTEGFDKVDDEMTDDPEVVIDSEDGGSIFG